MNGEFLTRVSSLWLVPADFGPLSSLFLSSMTALSGLGQSQGGSIYRHQEDLGVLAICKAQN